MISRIVQTTAKFVSGKATASKRGANSLYLDTHWKEIQAASTRIRGYVRRTPLLPTDFGEAVFVKPESLQPTGSFKVRGAFNAILSIRAEDPAIAGVVAGSSGNHGQAVAYAARVLGIRAIIAMPEDSNPVKVDAVRNLGAETVAGVTWENRDEVVARIAEERQLAIVHPFDDWSTIYGQGTVATEVFAECSNLGAVVAPVGGGGLLAGIALATKALTNSRATVIGVEPEVASDASESLRRGVRHSLQQAPQTVADGVRAKRIGARNFEVLVDHGCADEIVTVSEEEILTAVGVAWRQLRLVIEPTGALPIAALLAGKLPASRVSRPIALILSGGNINPAVLPAALTANAPNSRLALETSMPMGCSPCGPVASDL